MINIIYQKVRLCLESYNRETLIAVLMFSLLLFYIFPKKIAIIILTIGFLINLFVRIFDKSIKKTSHYSTTCMFIIIVTSSYLLLGESEKEHFQKHSKNNSISPISSLERAENDQSRF